MAMRRVYGRQLERKENLSLITLQKRPQRSRITDRSKSKQGGYSAETHQTVRRTQLLGKRMPIAQPIGRVAQRQLCLSNNHFGRSHRVAGARSPSCFLPCTR